VSECPKLSSLTSDLVVSTLRDDRTAGDKQATQLTTLNARSLFVQLMSSRHDRPDVFHEIGRLLSVKTSNSMSAV